MIRLVPVKAFTRNDENLLVMKEIQGKLLIIIDIEFLGIDLREYVKCRTRLYSGNSRNIIQSLIDKISLLVNTSAWLDILIDTLISAQCSLYNRLCRNIGAKAHGRKHVDSFYITFGLVLGSA